jgi:hypothetical protein
MSKILLSALLLVLPVAGLAAPKGKSTVAPKAGDFIGNWQCRTQIGDEVQDDSTIQFKPNARYTSQATLTFRIDAPGEKGSSQPGSNDKTNYQYKLTANGKWSVRGNILTFHDQKTTKLHKHTPAAPELSPAPDSPEAAIDKQLARILQNRSSESYRILTFTPDLFTLTNAANPPLMGMTCQRIKK